MHRDIKSANIVVGERGSFVRPDGTLSNYDRVLKLADFGLSRVMTFPPKPLTKEIATLNWRAPEVILDNLKYNFAVDLWSIGVVIYEMLTGRLPFEGSSEIEYLLSIFRMKGTPVEQANLFFKNSPVLQLFAAKLPQFKSMGIRQAASRNNKDPRSKLVYGFDELIDALTMVDPSKRPSCSHALQRLGQIRANYEVDMEGGCQYNNY